MLVVDLPGHGRSPRSGGPLSVNGMAAEVMRVLIDEADPPPPVIGISRGGCVGLALALQAPDAPAAVNAAVLEFLAVT